MAVLTKSGIDQRLQHLQDGLLNQSVDHGGYPQLSFAAIWLGNADATHRTGLGRYLMQCFPHRHDGRRSFSFGSLPGLRLLQPLLTSRSGLRRRPFRRQARSHQVRAHSFAAQPPNLRRPIFGHNSFAVSCLLALIGNALYLVLVHRLAVSLDASSPRSVALPQLRFTSLAVISLRRDFHPQECAHAGRTQKRLATSVASL